MSGRRLVSIRRRVPAADLDGYRETWKALRLAVESGGSHAWGFVSASDRTEVLEFLEFAEGMDPRADREVAAALEALGERFGGSPEEWEESG